MTKKIATNGTWPSKITSQDVADKSPKLSEPTIHNDSIFWLQAQALEKGRMCIMKKSTASCDSSFNSDMKAEAMLPPGFNVRSKVHEYGGGAYCVTDDHIVFVNSDDQQIYLIDYREKNNTYTAQQLTNVELRFADLHHCPQHNAIFAVAEDHRQNEIKNKLVAIPMPNIKSQTTKSANAKQPLTESNLCIVHEGHDFYAYPRVSPNGEYLAFITWDHPNMPWDNTCLRLCSITNSSVTNSSEIKNAIVKNDSIIPNDKPQYSRTLTFVEISLREAQHESIFQPQWSPTNDLFFVSDINNWWNIYSYSLQQIHKSQQHTATNNEHEDHSQPVLATQHTNLDAEFATPLWNFNMSTYGFLNDSEIFAAYNQHSKWHVCTFNRHESPPHPQEHVAKITCASSSISGIYCDSNNAVFIGASPRHFPAIHIFNNTSKVITAITNTTPELSASDISVARTCVFLSDDTSISAFFYAPTNSQVTSNELPPMIVISHGGPTGQTENAFNYKIQYWTNRGFSVLDVNYRGSTGYGRIFRHLLQKQWGVLDVADLVNAAEYIIQNNWAAADKKIIKGSSAGGYSVLAALAFKDSFDAGVSLYGIGDLELLASDTHKFEARYLDGLIGPYPEEKQLYHARSPINHIEKFNCPLLLFQGLEDKVVPPNQASAIAEALHKKGIPVTHIEYSDEGHGFRSPINIESMMTSEQEFYRNVFKLA